MWSETAAAAVAGVLVMSAPAAAQPPADGVTIVEHVGAAIPRDVGFLDQAGRPVALGSLLEGKPLILALGYFSCPMLCPVGEETAADAIRDSGLTLGRDFRAVTVSIDPTDGPERAREWRDRAAARVGIDANRLDWQFLTGSAAAARRLADTVGWTYAYDTASGQYSHPAGVVIVGADGRVSRYLYGITYTGRDLAAAIDDARQNRRVSSVAAFILKCFHYVPAARAHGGFVVWMLRGCGALVSIAIASALLVLWRREPA